MESSPNPPSVEELERQATDADQEHVGSPSDDDCNRSEDTNCQSNTEATDGCFGVDADEKPPTPPPRLIHIATELPSTEDLPGHWTQEEAFRRPATPTYWGEEVQAKIKEYSRKLMYLPSRGWDEVTPGIIIAEGEVAENISLLKRIGATHVINTCEGTGSYFLDADVKSYNEAGLQYFGIHAEDRSDYDISKHFEDANRILADCIEYRTAPAMTPADDNVGPIVHSTRSRKGIGNVVVNCKAGASRSATIVLAFLLSIGWDLPYAIDKILESREICPNNGFLGLLIMYEKECVARALPCPST